METNTKTPENGVECKDVYAIVTERIIEQLEKGTVPWRKSWGNSGLPRNLFSKKYYRGINLMLLASLGYEQNLFITFKQLKEIGDTVKKDEKGHIVVYWKYPEKDQNKVEGEESETKKNLFCDITQYSM